MVYLHIKNFLPLEVFFFLFLPLEQLYKDIFITDGFYEDVIWFYSITEKQLHIFASGRVRDPTRVRVEDLQRPYARSRSPHFVASKGKFLQNWVETNSFVFAFCKNSRAKYVYYKTYSFFGMTTKTSQLNWLLISNSMLIQEWKQMYNFTASPLF